MRHRRHLIAVILLYVALDLSLAAIPGAFVFNAEESVESTVTTRARMAGPVAAAASAPSEFRWHAAALRSRAERLPDHRRRPPLESMPRRGASAVDVAEPASSDTPH